MKFSHLACSAVLLFALCGCSRLVPGAKLSLSIPFRSDQGGFALDDILEVAIINIHIPGRPKLVRQFEFHNGSVPMGQDLNLTIEDIPRGEGYTIQFLGVYQNENSGAMKFLYDDAVTDVKAGTTTVELTTDNVGTSDSMAQIAGRYLTTGDPNPDTGPTGTMILQFRPPNSAPIMDVEKKYIINGWFQIFALDSTTASFRYILQETGEVIFDTLQSPASMFTGASSLLHMVKPISARKESSGVRVSPVTHLYLGYFGPGVPAGAASIGPLTVTPYKTCYTNTAEGIPNTYTDSTLATPLDYTAAGGTGVHWVDGGLSDSFNMFIDAGSDCTPARLTSGRALIFQHNHGSDESGFSGMSPPYKSMRPWDLHRSFLTGEYEITPDVQITLRWKYLPGAGAGLDGAVSYSGGTEIFAKYSTGSDSSHGEETCPPAGYTSVGSASTSSELFEVTQVAGVPLNSSTMYNYRFAACAYRMAGGAKQYLGKYVQGDCLSGSCGGIEHFGWAPSTADWSGPGGALDFASNFGGFSQRLLVVDSVTDDYTSMTVTSASSFNAGGEVMLIVNGASSNSACGTFNGQNIDVGMTHLARLLYNSGATLKIARGTFADALMATPLNNSPDSTGFCYVQVVQVPHFHNINLTGRELGTQTFDYGVNGGGIVALRANGTFSLGGSGDGINVGGQGYQSGANTIPHGAGERRAPSATLVSDIGGDNDGGGGGLGNGGGGSAANGGVGNSAVPTSGTLRMLFGGGGASVGPPSQGNGGGIIAVVANKTISNSGAFWANGNPGWSTAGAGGGGGTINLVTNDLSGSGINFNASGGGAQGSGNFGGGGAGFSFALACSNSISGTGHGNAGGAPVGTGAAGSALTYSPYVPPAQFWMCQ